MAKTRLPYAAEFRRQMVELVRAGGTPEELAAEFEPTAQSIRNWVAQSERNAGRGDGGLTTAEREELNRLRRENRQLRLEREILSKAAAWFARETNAIPVEGFRFVSDHQAAYPTTTMCELLGVSSSGYYAWIKRRPSQRAETDTMLIAEIHVARGASRGTYGAPRIHAELLAAKGLRVGRKRIAPLMAGLAPVSWRGESLGSDYLIWRHVGLLFRDILWFGSGRSHSSVPACTMVRPSRTAAVKDGPFLGPPEGLVLDGSEHYGRLVCVGIDRGRWMPPLIIDR